MIAGGIFSFSFLSNITLKSSEQILMGYFREILIFPEVPGGLLPLIGDYIKRAFFHNLLHCATWCLYNRLGLGFLCPSVFLVSFMLAC